MTQAIFSDTRETILQILREKGPLTAASVSKETGLPITVVTANLSLLVRREEIVKHHLGSTKLPLYALPGGERAPDKEKQ